ncbi:hypothetical protein [Paraburkholderia sp. BL6669N2]|uniref:hypothetical protein n=1 Tax=Paraburkholderia sp. BL6669N2 TaxID=1938807 RepID=UPI000E28605B|nr:hypothetical protein [Paraburkholderia sp. BL6669N2]
MIRSGELLTEEEFRQRRPISTKQLLHSLASGSIFSVEVEGAQYYPALLANPEQDYRRLATICRILWPAEPHSRLHFLTARNAALGGMTPLEAMRNDESYRRLLVKARGWASEWSRTLVEVRIGECLDSDAVLPLACTAVTEIDPRISIWRRAFDALESAGNVQPDGPYPKAAAVTVFISRSAAGQAGVTREMRLDILVEKGVAHAGVVVAGFPRSDLPAVRVHKSDDVVEVALKVIRQTSKRASQR